MEITEERALNAVEFEANDLRPVYILRGGDAYLKDVVLGRIKNAVPDDSGINYIRFDDGAGIRELVAEAETFSFLGGKKALVYKAPQGAKISDGDKNLLADYVKAPCETTVMVLDDDAGAFKFADKYAEIITCGGLEPALVMRWLKNSLQRRGFSIDASVAETLIKYCNGDMLRIRGEADKLMCFAAERSEKNIALADVNECVAPDTETQVFELTDRLAKKDGKNAVGIYGILLERGETPSFLLSLITSQFRRIMHAKLSSLADAELAAAFKVKEYSIVIARRLSANFSNLALKKIIDKLTMCEYLFKSGTISEKAALDLSFSYILTV
ncbi:MAG: DNA polymerase III subunit delta [Clostridiales bacterium]|jgi:DNA polymerase-3 subunit delta|nr:DNA polymerase III subunit delta [Clostridiales bacterium]